MRLEAHAESARQGSVDGLVDPFDAAAGYHRIALDVMLALGKASPDRIVVNVANQGAIADLGPDDVVEVPCFISQKGAQPIAAGSLPEAVRGLVQSVKTYERLAIRTAVEGSMELARLALLVHPLVGDWELAGRLTAELSTYSG